jgi:hypothetical protein
LLTHPVPLLAVLELLPGLSDGSHQELGRILEALLVHLLGGLDGFLYRGLELLRGKLIDGLELQGELFLLGLAFLALVLTGGLLRLGRLLVFLGLGQLSLALFLGWGLVFLILVIVVVVLVVIFFVLVLFVLVFVRLFVVIVV